jgi:hypothetical protein
MADQLRLAAGNLDDLITWLGKLDIRDLRYELEKLRALREWALDRAGVDYEEGGAVRVRSGYAVARLNKDGSPNGWWHYRECLAGGALGTVTRIDFSPHQMAWYAGFRPDREWSVSETGGKTVRRWHGPVADTPEGYEPPSAFDQENYPDGRKHIFSMRAEDLRGVPP